MPSNTCKLLTNTQFDLSKYSTALSAHTPLSGEQNLIARFLKLGGIIKKTTLKSPRLENKQTLNIMTLY